MIRRSIATAAVALMVAGAAQAGTLSTSAMSPTLVGPSGVVEGAFPESGKATYYVSADVGPGTLLTQVSYAGRKGAQKSVDLSLLGANARRVDGYWVQGTEASDEKTRSFAIDSTGKQVLRLEVEGPPTASFRVELGGPALVNSAPKTAPNAAALSHSVFAPTPVGAGGVVEGKLPGEDKRAVYYVAVDVQKGDLLTQISVEGREGADKSVSFEMLGGDARGSSMYWVHGSGASEEKTRSFPIDKDGRQIIRLVVEGPETAGFKVELGGSAVARKPPPADGGTVAAGGQRPSI